MNPFFSVVIPSYNRRHLIEPVIESVRSQTFPSWEIIVVDDGSTDDTVSFLKERYATDDRIHILSQVNSERGAARNNGFRHAKGMYVCFLDSDDFFLPDHLQTLKDAIEAHNQPDFICTKFLLRRKGKTYPGDITGYMGGYYDYKMFLNGNPIACNICVSRTNSSLKLFEEDRAYSVKEDWLFMLQNLFSGKMLLVDKVTVIMEDHDERSMRSDDRMIVAKTLKAYEWIHDHLSLPKEDDRILQAHIHFLCSVHSYLAGDRWKTISYIYKAIRLRGWRIKYTVLLFKGILGRNIVRILYPVKH